MVRILIVDDHQVVRTGVKALVSEMTGWTVCGEAANGHDAIALALQLQPDVVLMDVSMPGMSGVEAAKEIRKAHPDVKIILLSMHDRAQVAAAAQAAGARVDACVCKDSLTTELEIALNSVALVAGIKAATGHAAPDNLA
jgi:DNA-binding NarL/FixJ family response regulator